MTILQQISEDRTFHRKQSKEHPAHKLMATILTTLLGEVSIVGKNDGNRETTDEEAVKIIQKFIKGVDDNKQYRKLSDDELMEISLYKAYLPEMIDDETITLFVKGYLDGIEDGYSMKIMGTIIKELKFNYPGQVDGKAASAVVKTQLQEYGA